MKNHTVNYNQSEIGEIPTKFFVAKCLLMMKFVFRICEEKTLYLIVQNKQINQLVFKGDLFIVFKENFHDFSSLFNSFIYCLWLKFERIVVLFALRKKFNGFSQILFAHFFFSCGNLFNLSLSLFL